MLETIDAKEFAKRCKEKKRIIIDVRTAGEFAGGSIQGAKNMDIMSPTFTTELEALDRNTAYAIYCHSGNRSGFALHAMETLGFTDVIDLDGGIIDWVSIGEKLY